MPRVHWLLFLLFPLIGADLFGAHYDLLNPKVDISNLKKSEKYVPWTSRILGDDSFETFESMRSAMAKHDLNDTEIKELEALYPNVTVDWDMFNHEYRADDTRFINGSDRERDRLLYYRMILLSEEALRKFKESSRELDNGEIDFFEEYFVAKRCLAADRIMNGAPSDKVVIDGLGRVHYTRETLYCDMARPDCEFLRTWPDTWQGRENKNLERMMVRVSNGHRAFVNKFRTFASCATKSHPSAPKPYPTLEDRLIALGIPVEFLDDPSPNVLLTLRQFTEDYLNNWRNGTKLFDESHIKDLTKKDEDIQTNEYLEATSLEAIEDLD